MITKDGRDTPIEKLTAENYIVPKGEEKDYHAVIEVVQFDPKTGKRISRPRVQKFGKKIFEAHVANSLRKQGYTVTILHDPNVWLKEQAARPNRQRPKRKPPRPRPNKKSLTPPLRPPWPRPLRNANRPPNPRNRDAPPRMNPKSNRPGRNEK